METEHNSPKLLMFSRFRATPPSVAALLSFGVEERYLLEAKPMKRSIVNADSSSLLYLARSWRPFTLGLADTSY
jgi:hypothetical protein